jgi:type IV secretion system protein VirB5
VFRTGKIWLIAFLVCGGGVPLAEAQFAVIDVASVTQLISQLNTLEQQLATARAELAQAQTLYQSTVGGRGMEQLLAGTNRNYLPPTWSAIQSTVAGGPGGYSTLSSDVTSALSANAVLSAQQLAHASPAVSLQIQSDRQSVALLQAVSHEALATTSNRFASLQQLINAIGHASDQKAALDLQARIGAEAGMLQNEQTKLQVLYQSIQAQQWANDQRAREQIVATHGQFSSRFQPQP